MPARLEAFGYGTHWHDISTDYYEGYSNSMTDYHMHDYYEISLILSGNVKVLLSDHSEYGQGAKLVLLRPHTPHFIVCASDRLYRRHNLLFSPEFLADYTHDLQRLLPLFGKHGTVFQLNEDLCHRLLGVMDAIQKESSSLRQRLLVLYLLSLVSENAPEDQVSATVPSLVSEALNYVAEHFGERISAADMAWALHVGRTTLMTTFKKHTGVTLNRYITHYRLKNAIEALKQGDSEPEVARACGFNDSCNMIRCFKKHLGKSPMRYLSEKVQKP